MDNKLSSEIVFDGMLGFLVSSDTTVLDERISVVVDGISQPFTAVAKDHGLHLLQVDLTQAPTRPGKSSWTVVIVTH